MPKYGVELRHGYDVSMPKYGVKLRHGYDISMWHAQIWRLGYMDASKMRSVLLVVQYIWGLPVYRYNCFFHNTS